jgi:hypothetical protein
MCVKFVCALVAQDPDEDSKRTNSKGKSELKTLKKYSTKKMAKDEEVGEECHDEQVCLSPSICMCVYVRASVVS